MEAKDALSLLVTIDLAIFASALTLLAIYPAVSMAIDAARRTAGGSEVLGQERQRKAAFFWLGIAATFSFVALMLLMLNTMSFVFAARPEEGFSFCCMLSDSVLAIVEAWVFRVVAAVTFVGLLGVGRAGWVIFRQTKDWA